MSSFNRRHFSATSGVGVGAQLLADQTAFGATPRRHGSSRKPVLMKLDTQEPTSEENFIRFQRYGVKNGCGWYKIADEGRGYPTVDELKAVTTLGEKYGVSIDMTDCDIGRGDKSTLMLGKAQSAIAR